MSVAQEVRGCSSMVEPLPSKQIVRVRFSSPAPSSDSSSGRIGAFVFPKNRHSPNLGGIFCDCLFSCTSHFLCSALSVAPSVISKSRAPENFKQDSGHALDRPFRPKNHVRAAMAKVTFGSRTVAIAPKYRNFSEKAHLDLDFRKSLSYSYLSAPWCEPLQGKTEWRIIQQVIDLIAGRSSAW